MNNINRIVGLKVAVLLLSLIHLALFFSLKSEGEWFFITSIFIYVVINYNYLRSKSDKTIFTFELFFALSFFLSCFLTYIIDVSSNYVMNYYTISETAKCRFINLALSGYYSYLFGVLLIRDRNVAKRRFEPYIPFSFVKFCNYITSLFVFLFFLRGGGMLLNRYTEMESSYSTYADFIFYIAIFNTMSSMAVIMSIGNQRMSLRNIQVLHYVVNTSIMLILYLASGFRSQFLQLTLPIMYLYFTYMKKVSNKKVLLLLGIGIVLMLIVGFFRGGGQYEGGHDFAYILRDFVTEDIAGVWLVEYTDSHGPTGGSNVIIQATSAVPFLSGSIKSLFGAESFTISSSRVFTYAFRNDGSGLGTNVIGDLYFSFGVVGVLVFMFLLGLLVKKVFQSHSLYSKTCYLLLLGNAIFSTRVEFFYIVRFLGFSIIILFLIKSILKFNNSYIIK